MTSSDSKTPYYFSVILGATLLGLSGFFVKSLSIPILAIAGFRLSIPIVFLLIFHQRDVFAQPFLPSMRIAVASVFTAIRSCLWIIAMTFAPISKAIVVLYLWPVFFAVFAKLFLNQVLGVKKSFLLALSFVGLLVLYGDRIAGIHDRETIGLLCKLLVAIINAGVFLVFKEEMASRSRFQILFYDNLIGSMIFLPWLLYHLPSLEPSSIAFAALYGLTVGYLGYAFLYLGLGSISAASVSVLSYIEAVVACAIGIFLFDEAFTWRFVVGGLLIFFSAAFVRDKIELVHRAEKQANI